MKNGGAVFLSSVANRYPDSSLVDKKYFFKLKGPQNEYIYKNLNSDIFKITILFL